MISRILQLTTKLKTLYKYNKCTIFRWKLERTPCAPFLNWFSKKSHDSPSKLVETPKLIGNNDMACTRPSSNMPCHHFHWVWDGFNEFGSFEQVWWRTMPLLVQSLNASMFWYEMLEQRRREPCEHEHRAPCWQTTSSFNNPGPQIHADAPFGRWQCCWNYHSDSDLQARVCILQASHMASATKWSSFWRSVVCQSSETVHHAQSPPPPGFMPALILLLAVTHGNTPVAPIPCTYTADRTSRTALHSLHTGSCGHTWAATDRRTSSHLI